MPINREYPYTNIHDLNMDWILEVVKTFQGQYSTIDQKITDAVEELTEQGQSILDAFTASLHELTAEEQAAVIAAINAHAAETIASIPDDYTALSNKVTALETVNAESYIEENENATVRLNGFVPHYFLLENGNIQGGVDTDSAKAKRLRTVGYLRTDSIQFIVNKAIQPSKIYINYYDDSFVYQTGVDTGKISEPQRFTIDKSYPYIRFTYICYESEESSTQVNINPDDGYEAIFCYSNKKPSAGSLEANNIIASKFDEKAILEYPVLEQGNVQGGVDTNASLTKRVRSKGYYSTKDIKRVKVISNDYIRIYVNYFSAPNSDDYVGYEYADQEINISSTSPYCRIAFIKYDDAQHSNQVEIVPQDIEEAVVFTGGLTEPVDNKGILNSLEGLREQLGETERRLNVVEQANNIDTVPSFYETYITNRIADINALAPDEGDQFIFATDYHGLPYGNPSKYNNNNHMKSLINRIVYNTSISITINGGDVANSYQGRRSRAEFLRGIRKICQYHKPDDYATTLFVAGNHDLGCDGNGNAITDPVISENDLYINSGLASIASKLVIDPATVWNYYFDNETAKVRYIVLLTPNLADWGFSNTSACYDFLARSLQDMATGWTAVVIYHWAFTTSDTVTTQTTTIATIMSNYNARGEYGAYNFSEGAGVAPVIISGHQHKDLDTTLTPVQGYPIIVIMTTTECWDGEVESSENTREENTTSEDAFDVFSIDTENKTIHATRIGGGSDRSWSYD